MSAAATCPKWERCGAPVCPLDDDWELRKHLNGEPVCWVIRQVAKLPAGMPLERILNGDVTGGLAKKVSEPIRRIISHHAHIKIAFQRAAKSGSRLGRPMGAKR